MLTAAQIKDIITEPLNLILTSADGLVSTMTGHGSTLLGAIMSAVLAWEGIKIAMEVSSINEAVAKLVNLILIVSITFLLFDNYDSYFGRTGYLMSGFDTIAASFGLGDLKTTISNAVTDFMSMAGQIMGIGNAKPPAEEKSWWESMKEMTEIGTALATFVDWLPSLIIRAAAALVTMLAGGIFVIQMLLSQLAVIIGVAIGPIMIPWMLIPATSFIFEGWLKFMITAGMWKVVGAIVFAIANPTIRSLAQKTYNTNGMESEFGTLTLMALGILFVSVVIAVLMSKIQEIAQALVSGGSMGGLSQRWSTAKITGAATGTSRAVAATGGGVGMARNAAKAASAARAGGASKAGAAVAGAKYAAQQARHNFQNGGKAIKPTMPGGKPNPPTAKPNSGGSKAPSAAPSNTPPAPPQQAAGGGGSNP